MVERLYRVLVAFCPGKNVNTRFTGRVNCLVRVMSRSAKVQSSKIQCCRPTSSSQAKVQLIEI